MASASVPVPKLPHIASADRDSNPDLSYDKDDESRRTHRSAAIATAPDTQTTKAEAPTTTVTNKTEEQFDDDGNPVRVANLEFFEGILGKGAYGTVRLARRRPVPVPPSPPPSEHGDIAAVPPPPNHRHDQIHHRARRGRRSNRNGTDYFRSSSAPVKSAFFNGNEAKPAPGSDSMTRRRSSYNLLTDDDEDDEESATQIRFALPPNLVQRASSTFSSLFDEDRHHRHSQGDCELVAVKICSKSILKRMRTMERDNVTHKMKVRTALEKVEREIALMKKMRHPNLVTLFEVIDSPSTNMLYMVLEYMPLGEILTYQNDGTFRRQPKKAGESKLAGVNKFGYFDEAHAALYFVDILHALAYLHQHHICHRDLKPENILLDARGIVKISDFGVSHFFEKEHGIGARRVDSTPASSSDGNSSNDNSHHDDESQQQLDSKELCFKQVSRLTRRNTDTALRMTGMHNAGLLTKTEGTWCFWSPEMCQSGTSTFSGYAADLWAAGVCLYIFVTGKLPFYSEVPTDLFDMIAEAKVRYEGLGLSNSLLDLLKTTLEKDPARRAGVGDCLKHKFLQVAREKRIRQLSAELERSGKRQLVVGEDDMRRAFRIVNIPNPALLLRTAQKQIKETYYAARDRMSSLYSQSSQSSVDGADEGVLHNSSRTFSRRHSTTSSSSSVASDNAMNPEPVLPRKLFTIPHDRKITDSTEAASASMSVDSTPMSTDGKKKEEMESATALRKVSKIPQTSGSSTFTKKSKANKTVNAKKTKRRKGGCVVQ